jgi:hypothetical protein
LVSVCHSFCKFFEDISHRNRKCIHYITYLVAIVLDRSCVASTCSFVSSFCNRTCFTYCHRFFTYLLQLRWLLFQFFVWLWQIIVSSVNFMLLASYIYHLAVYWQCIFSVFFVCLFYSMCFISLATI